MDGRGLSAYHTVDCVGIKPERLMMVGLEALQATLARAIAAIDGENGTEKARLLGKAGTVVEFMLGLTNIAPGELSERLAKLYRFVLRGIAQGNLGNDKEAIAGALHVIDELAKFWRGRFPGAVSVALS